MQRSEGGFWLRVALQLGISNCLMGLSGVFCGVVCEGTEETLLPGTETGNLTDFSYVALLRQR